MSRLSPNAPCPCGSGEKYKRCCRRYHHGAHVPDALSLIKSRYSAYAAGEAQYIIATTHPDNPQYDHDTRRWEAEILAFCRATRFEGLEILEYREGDDEAFVRFIARLSGTPMEECSHFLQEGRWLYHDAVTKCGEASSAFLAPQPPAPF